jgi:hypothetical protein
LKIAITRFQAGIPLSVDNPREMAVVTLPGESASERPLEYAALRSSGVISSRLL